MNIFEMLDGQIPPAELVAIGQVVEPELPPEVIGRRLSESEIVELWQERSAIIHESNVELVCWCQSEGFSTNKAWRYVELCAAAGMSLNHGTYVEAVIRPRIRPESE